MNLRKTVVKKRIFVKLIIKLLKANFYKSSLSKKDFSSFAKGGVTPHGVTEDLGELRVVFLDSP